FEHHAPYTLGWFLMDLKAISGIPAGLLPTVHRHTRTPELGNPDLPAVQTHQVVSQRFPPFFPLFRPPLRLDAWLSFLPRPLPDFLPPPDSLLTVAQARLFAVFFETPRFS